MSINTLHKGDDDDDDDDDNNNTHTVVSDGVNSFCTSICTSIVSFFVVVNIGLMMEI